MTALPARNGRLCSRQPLGECGLREPTCAPGFPDHESNTHAVLAQPRNYSDKSIITIALFTYPDKLALPNAWEPTWRVRVLMASSLATSVTVVRQSGRSSINTARTQLAVAALSRAGRRRAVATRWRSHSGVSPVQLWNRSDRPLPRAGSPWRFGYLWRLSFRVICPLRSRSS